MPQDSVIYGVSRIRCHEKNLLGPARLQRMLDGNAEEAVRQLMKKPAPKRGSSAPTFYREMELALGEVLSRRVRVTRKGKDKGELTVEFYSEEELRDFAARLERGEGNRS